MPILHIEHGIRDFDTWKGPSTAHPAGDRAVGRAQRIRWERDPLVHMAFLPLACALICRRYLRGF